MHLLADLIVVTTVTATRIASGQESPAIAITYLVWNLPANLLMFLWWFSLSVATYLARGPLASASRAAKAEVMRLRESPGAAIDQDRWQAEIEAPALHLANELLPAFSDQWGRSVLLNGFGLLLWTLSFVVGAHDTLLNPAVETWIRCTYALVVTCVSTIPFLIVSNPAGVSSSCGQLVNT